VKGKSEWKSGNAECDVGLNESVLEVNNMEWMIRKGCESKRNTNIHRRLHVLEGRKFRDVVEVM
jgi:hypothetical protein